MASAAPLCDELDVPPHSAAGGGAVDAIRAVRCEEGGGRTKPNKKGKQAGKRASKNVRMGDVAIVTQSNKQRKMGGDQEHRNDFPGGQQK